ncbi:MAG: hypothetical protein RIC87_12605 [Kiloniellales bacterium]
MATNRKKGISVQGEQKKGRGRPKGGLSEIARQIGTSRARLIRAQKIAGLTEEAKQVARETGLDNHQGHLLQASDLPPEDQANGLRLAAEMRAFKADNPRGRLALEDLRKAWRRATPTERQTFLSEVLDDQR